MNEEAANSLEVPARVEPTTPAKVEPTTPAKLELTSPAKVGPTTPAKLELKTPVKVEIFEGSIVMDTATFINRLVRVHPPIGIA